jgi:hypothetical protein
MNAFVVFPCGGSAAITCPVIAPRMSRCYRGSSRPNRATHAFPPLRTAWERCLRLIEHIFRMSE